VQFRQRGVGSGRGPRRDGRLIRRQVGERLQAEFIHQDLGVALGAVDFALGHQHHVRFHQAAEARPGLGEHHQFDVALHVLEGDEAHRVAFFGLVLAEACHQTGHAHLLVLPGLSQLRRVMRHLAAQHGQVG